MSHLGDSLPFCDPGTFHVLPLSHSPPQNLLYLLKRKTLPILFQPVKTFESVERHGLFSTQNQQYGGNFL
ncbi:hypothetical protein D1641_12970 [Colidextribacter sp. OB.20]|nr:hypothetical protein [Colidextribacter sp. OB.20]